MIKHKGVFMLAGIAVIIIAIITSILIVVAAPLLPVDSYTAGVIAWGLIILDMVVLVLPGVIMVIIGNKLGV